MNHLLRHWFIPHYTNNHRPIVIQPKGLAFLVGCFLLFQTVIQLSALTPSLPRSFVLGFASSITPTQVIDLTNAERAKSGLAPLHINEKLNQAAQSKAAHMFQHDYWAHIAPDGTTPWVFMKNAGYAYSVAGENLARDFGDTPTMVQAWMNSPTHKANIVHTKYSEIGIAVVNGKLQGVETTLVVQMFGNPATVVAKTLPNAASASSDPAKETTHVVNQPESHPVPQAVEVAQLQMEPQPDRETQAIQGTQTKVISPLLLTKLFSSMLILVLVVVLAYDSYVMTNRGLPRKVGNNWAHVAFLGIVLALILVITNGSVI